MKTTYKISSQTTVSRMIHSLIIYAILVGLLYAAATVPLANVVLQTNMNGNGQAITNLASVTATNFYGSVSQAANAGYATNSGYATNAGNATYSGSATNVLSIVPASLGGTGTATTSQSYFFAGPTSGSGAPGFRSIVVGDVPNLNQNTTGTAASLSTASALPNGTTATTQTAGDISTKVATDQYVQAAIVTSGGPYMPVRQTVLSGPIDVVLGTPTYLPATSASLSLTTQNISSSPGLILVVTSANGFGLGGAINTAGTTNSSLTWASLTANTTNYLYVTISGGVLTTGFSTLAPIYEFTGNPSTTNNQFTFNINQMIGYMGNGSTAPQANIVFIGEAVTGSSTVTSTVAYGYQGAYDSGYTSTLPGSGSILTFSSNLGYKDNCIGAFRIKNLTSEQSYSIGDIISVVGTSPASSVIQTISPILSGRNSTVVPVGSNQPFFAPNKSTGAGAILTNVNWAYALSVKRNW